MVDGPRGPLVPAPRRVTRECKWGGGPVLTPPPPVGAGDVLEYPFKLVTVSRRVQVRMLSMLNSTPGTSIHCTSIHCTSIHCTSIHCTCVLCTSVLCKGVLCTNVPCTGFSVQMFSVQVFLYKCSLYR